MNVSAAENPIPELKQPKQLSARIQWLRDYYFQGRKRKWNNEHTAWTTGTPWDIQYDETTYYIVPENYPLLQTFASSFRQSARPVKLNETFWTLSLPERRSWFVKEVMVNYVPQELLPGDLIAGARFNIQTSMCWTQKEAKTWNKRINGKHGTRELMKRFHDHGYGNSGATSGHLIPGHERILKLGWKVVVKELEDHYQTLSKKERKGTKGAQLRAMKTAANMPRELAEKYAKLCWELAAKESDQQRKSELTQMAQNLAKVPWEPATNFWEAMQALWINHMLVMSDENFPGPGVSFGNMDRYLLPYWEKSLADGMDREFGKEILKCFWVHANTAYDAMIRIGSNQGITAAYGQLISLSGMGANGEDVTNDLTYALMEVIDDMTPMLEPKPNVRLHKNTPDDFLDKVTDMIAASQGAPFLLNFDERAMAGLMREAEKADVTHLIHKDNVHEYASVGCLENTMVGNDRSGTVDSNLNLLKAVELALTGGKDLLPFVDPITEIKYPVTQDGPKTGSATAFTSWEQFWDAYKQQTCHIVKKCVDLYETTESLRAEFCPTTYLSCLVKGCAESGLDVTQGGAELSFTTIEGVTFATTVDSLLAIKYLVFDQQVCTMEELLTALRANWQGYEVLQAKALYKAPKYGCDDDDADELARQVMELWTEETWRHKTKSTHRQFRPGMLSWNYWVGDGFVLSASPNGRSKGQFLSNAICPSNGADTKGPTANVNSVGKALGGKNIEGQGDWKNYINYLPNGASHTITLNPSLMKSPEQRAKFKAFIRGYIENGGTALQINMLDREMLMDAQKHPQNYRNLLVRITGYNAYFTSVGRELQDEVIARLGHDI